MAAFILPVFAEAIPAGSSRDSRIQTAVYHNNQVYHIRGQIGRAVLVQLEDGETLSGESSALGMGDSDAWKVAVKGNNIIFKPTVL
ncbi:MAG: TrbG/VirB9 family P-type conjugative transfer protein, partial [Snodgrassella alvi]|nr:TrbG/VirB9 family P-type conjugative transfer protein [Snodgrassella alvi]